MEIFKTTIKSILYPALFHLGVYDRIIERCHQNKIVILWCHRVSSEFGEKRVGVPPLKFERGVTREGFEALMCFLREKMHPVSIEEVVNFVNGEKGIPDRAVAVMLDDGYMDNYLYAFPILKRYEIPATIFLTTGFIETGSFFWWDRIGEILKRTRIATLEMNEIRHLLNGNREWLPDSIYLYSRRHRNIAWRMLTAALKHGGPDQVTKVIELMEDRLEVKADAYRHLHAMLTWEQIREMSESGIDFGAHTVSHPFLPDLSADDFEKEAMGSKKAIEDQIRKPVISLAYPFGELPTPKLVVKEKLRECGIQCAFLTEEGYVCKQSDPFELKRLGIGDVTVGMLVRELTAVLRQNSY